MLVSSGLVRAAATLARGSLLPNRGVFQGPVMKFETRKLQPEDAAAYVELRAIMLVQEPLAFLASPGDDRACRVDFVRERLADAEAAIFGAWAPQLVGAVGVYRHAGPKIAHKVGVWGMFVLPELRGAGLGRALMQQALAHARKLPDVMQITLSVSETQPAALRLYESLGFRIWGSEPLALRHAGRVVTEHHLALPVGDGAPPH